MLLEAVFIFLTVVFVAQQPLLSVVPDQAPSCFVTDHERLREIEAHCDSSSSGSDISSSPPLAAWRCIRSASLAVAAEDSEDFVHWLTDMMKDASVLNVAAGAGQSYGASIERVAARYTAVDAAFNIESASHGAVRHCNTSQPRVSWGDARSDFVVALDVHADAGAEQALLSNVAAGAVDRLLIAWRAQASWWLVDELTTRHGFELDARTTRRGRELSVRLSQSFLAFRRAPPPSAPPASARVAIVQSWHEPIRFEHLSELDLRHHPGAVALLQMATNAAYAARHGYAHVVVDSSAHAVMPPTVDAAVHAWGKMGAIMEAFQRGFDVVVWLDADAHFNPAAFDESLADVLEEALGWSTPTPAGDWSSLEPARLYDDWKLDFDSAPMDAVYRQSWADEPRVDFPRAHAQLSATTPRTVEQWFACERKGVPHDTYRRAWIDAMRNTSRAPSLAMTDEDAATSFVNPGVIFARRTRATRLALRDVYTSTRRLPTMAQWGTRWWYEMAAFNTPYMFVRYGLASWRTLSFNRFNHVCSERIIHCLGPKEYKASLDQALELYDAASKANDSTVTLSTCGTAKCS